MDGANFEFPWEGLPSCHSAAWSLTTKGRKPWHWNRTRASCWIGNSSVANPVHITYNIHARLPNSFYINRVTSLPKHT